MNVLTPAEFFGGISHRAVWLEWARVCKYAELEPTPVRFIPELDEEHEQDRRRYAQVVVDTGELQLANAFRRLYPPHRLGVYAHELGHRLLIEVLGKLEHTEEEADAVAKQHLGIEISYDQRWPGKGLQCATAAPLEAWATVDPHGIHRRLYDRT